MSTLTEDAIWATFRNRILTFTDGTATVASLIGGSTPRLYQVAPPDTAGFPYGIMRILSDGVGDIFSPRLLEITWIGRPLSQLPVVRRLGTLTHGALWQFVDVTNGYLRITGRSRDMLPQGVGDADASVVQEQHRFPFRAIERGVTDTEAA